MTKNQAMQAVATLTSGTIAGIIGSPKYAAIDAAVNNWVLAIAAADEEAFATCENWMQVLDIIR